MGSQQLRMGYQRWLVLAASGPRRTFMIEFVPIFVHSRLEFFGALKLLVL
jgi:hypothetical protein